jgi:hypothetical protein
LQGRTREVARTVVQEQVESHEVGGCGDHLGVAWVAGGT